MTETFIAGDGKGKNRLRSQGVGGLWLLHKGRAAEGAVTGGLIGVELIFRTAGIAGYFGNNRGGSAGFQ